ncbi:MAG: hypothetical protein A2Y33_14785 [Spirochaetes bacterium GWF1_51_8]|nr:MAG: hypothetical protein A2Y33_14785 [Spirochaetes bacterium GWF1_51_8]
MYRILTALVLFVVPCLASAQESAPSNVSLLILPLVNTTDVENSAGSDNYRILLFGPIYNFVNIIPGVTMPPRDKLLSMKTDNSNIPAAAALNLSDFVIYGDYALKGKTKKDIKIYINLYIWSQKLGAVFFQKSFVSGTDFEVLDTIDLMLEEIISQTLQKQLAVATLQFGGFKIGFEKYELLINDKSISEIAGSGFALNLKVLAEQNYQIVLRNLNSGQVAFDQTFKPKKGEAIMIGYYAAGHIIVPEIPNKKAKSVYDLYLIHGSETNMLEDKKTYSNMLAGRDYTFWLVEDKTNFAYTNTFTLNDKQTYKLEPKLKSTGGFGLRLTLNDGIMLNAHLDYFWNSWFYTGIQLGASPLPLLGDWGTMFYDSKFILSLSAGIDVGVYFLGGRGNEGLNLAGGLMARYYLYPVAPQLLQSTSVLDPSRSFICGPHIWAEYSIFLLGVGFYFAPLANFEMYSFPLSISLGLRFNF